MTTARQYRLWWVTALFATVLMALATPMAAYAAAITEPSTVFYGKVLGIGSDQPFLVTEGDLEWTVRREDGSDVLLKTTLFPLKGGEYSYRLDVPHAVLALGLSASSGTVPLSAEEQTHAHGSISVDGLVARILGPIGYTFDADAARRAATYRLDLAIPLIPMDTDGDGMPDWWEELHGLDKQDPGDADPDPDGDGWGNLSEYLGGTDPQHDDREPSLMTTILRAYAHGSTGLGLSVVDADSAAADLVYRIESLPSVGTLTLRNAGGASGGDLPLAINSSFTQEDVSAGKLVYVHAEEEALLESVSFRITLHDETSEHEAYTGLISLNLYHPGTLMNELEIAGAIEQISIAMPPMPPCMPPEEQQTMENYLLSRGLGFIVWDNSDQTHGVELAVPSSGLGADSYEQNYVPLYGQDRRQVLCGGFVADTLKGGMEDDVLVGGGGDDLLWGHGGSDVFVMNSVDDGNDVIKDYSIAEGDAIDVSRILCGESMDAADYIRVTDDGTNSLLGINAYGLGTSYDDLVLTVVGKALAEADLYDLIEQQHLRVGSRQLPARIDVAAVQPTASENGPVAGEFEVTRRGSAVEEIVVNLLIAGSAQNGVDYLYVSSQLTLPAGVTSASLNIMPNVDTLTELAEIVEVVVVSGAGYVTGVDRAVVSIEDLAPQVTIEALEPLIVLEEGQPGLFLLRRGGVIDRSLLVRLVVGGNALPGTDYAPITSYVNLQPNQTTALIEVVPQPDAVISGDAEFVRLGVMEDESYVVLTPAEAQVVFVRERTTLAQWQESYFPDVSDDPQVFAEADSGETGIRNFERYAFGLDPNDPGGSDGRPVFSLRDGYLTVSFRRPAAVTDVTYQVDVSDDLKTWFASPAYVEPVALSELEDDPEMSAWRAVRSIDVNKQYMRVKVEYSP